MALGNSYPEKVFVPPHAGSKGWLAMDLDRQGSDCMEVTELIEDSHRQIAPKGPSRFYLRVN